MKSKKQEKKIESYKSDLQRVQAEFENYTKRVEKEKETLKKFAPQDILKQFLQIQDDFERALNSMEHTKDVKEIKKGIKMIHDQFKETMKNCNVTEIEAKGKKFDPYKHEAIQRVQSKKNDGEIVEELQKGYMLYDKVLRHSKVKVAEKIKQSEDKKNE